MEQKVLTAAKRFISNVKKRKYNNDFTSFELNQYLQSKGFSVASTEMSKMIRSFNKDGLILKSLSTRPDNKYRQRAVWQTYH